VTGLHLAHLFVIGLWGGLVLAELAIELGARTPDELRAAARLHYRLDLLFELPLLLAILATGGALAARVPLGALHAVKIVAALGAIGANLLCVVLVVLRRRAEDDPLRVLRLSRWIRATGLAAPLGLLALGLGFRLVA
jgi:hypothetical protein